MIWTHLLSAAGGFLLGGSLALGFAAWRTGDNLTEINISLMKLAARRRAGRKPRVAAPVPGQIDGSLNVDLIPGAAPAEPST